MQIITLLHKTNIAFSRNLIHLFVQLRQIKSNIMALLLMLLLVSSSILLTSCGGGGGSSGSSSSGLTLTAVTVSPGTQTVPMGVFVQYTATGTYSNGETQDITNQVVWSSESAQNVIIGSNGVAVGTATDSALISATLNGVKGFAHLTITAATVLSIAVSPVDRSLAIGATLQYTATSTNSDGTTTALAAVNLVWASSAPGVATISTAGLATGVAAGSTTISATFNNTSGSSSIVGSTALSVTSVTPASLAVTFAGGATMPVGATQLANATVTFSDGSTQIIPANQVTWSSAAPTAATIDSSGTITGVTDGGTAIIASYLSVSGRASLTVRSATLVSIAANSLSPNGTISIQVGATNRLIATGTYNSNDGSAQFTFILNSATWSSTAPSLLTVSSAGIATGVAAGGPVSVRAAVGGILSPTGVASPNNNTFNVTSALNLVSISLTPANALLNGASGLQQQYVATGTYSDGSTANLTNVATWASGTVALATITTAGLYSGGLASVVAAAATTFGPTVISATYSSGTSTTSSVNLTVSPIRVVSVTVLPNPASGLTSVSSGGSLPAYVGLAYPLKAIATYSDGTNQDVTNMATWAVAAGTAFRIGNSPSVVVSDGTPAIAGNKGIAYLILAAGTATTITAAIGGVTSSTFSLASVAPTTIPTLVISPATTMPTTNVLPATSRLQQQYKAIVTVTAPATVVGSFDVSNCPGWTSSIATTATVGTTSSPSTSVGSSIGNAGLVTVATPAPATGATTSISLTLSPVPTSTTPAVVTIGTTTLSSIAITPTPTSPATMFFMPNSTFATKLFFASGTYTGGTGAGTYDLTQLSGWTSSNTAVASIANGSSNSGTSPLLGGGVATAVGLGTTNIGFTLGSVSATPVAVKVQ
jgi:hypothetical protein